MLIQYAYLVVSILHKNKASRSTLMLMTAGFVTIYYNTQSKIMILISLNSFFSKHDLSVIHHKFLTV